MGRGGEGGGGRGRGRSDEAATRGCRGGRIRHDPRDAAGGDEDLPSFRRRAAADRGRGRSAATTHRRGLLEEPLALDTSMARGLGHLKCPWGPWLGPEKRTVSLRPHEDEWGGGVAPCGARRFPERSASTSRRIALEVHGPLRGVWSLVVAGGDPRLHLPLWATRRASQWGRPPAWSKCMWRGRWELGGLTTAARGTPAGG